MTITIHIAHTHLVFFMLIRMFVSGSADTCLDVWVCEYVGVWMRGHVNVWAGS